MTRKGYLRILANLLVEGATKLDLKQRNRSGELTRIEIKNILIMKSSILAQDERWRRGLGMQVERESISSEMRVEWRTGE